MPLTFNYNSDVIAKERSSLSFGDVNHLLKVRDSGRLKSIMSSISCLVTIAKTESSEEVSHLIDFVRGLRSEGYRVAKTQLLVMIPLLKHGMLRNKTINFNTMIIENGAGDVELKKKY